MFKKKKINKYNRYNNIVLKLFNEIMFILYGIYYYNLYYNACHNLMLTTQNQIS